MVYLMLYNRRCGHLVAFNYQHRAARTVLKFCRCE